MTKHDEIDYWLNKISESRDEATELTAKFQPGAGFTYEDQCKIRNLLVEFHSRTSLLENEINLQQKWNARPWWKKLFRR